jgi:hypothetical protein
MKKIWNYACILVCLLIASFTFSSCSDNDDIDEGTPLPVTEKNLIGTWELTYYEYKDQYESFAEEDNTVRVQFYADGTGKSWYKDGRWEEDDFSITDWYIKNDVLYIHDDEGDLEKATIAELTTNKLVLESYSEDRTQYLKETYRKLN